MLPSVKLLWHTPSPERMVALAMRRCYSTKPIEELEVELGAKGEEYTRYLISRAVKEQALDVVEHACASYYVECSVDAMAQLVCRHRFLNISELGEGRWLVTVNARTLYEMAEAKEEGLAKALVEAFAPLMPALFGERR